MVANCRLDLKNSYLTRFFAFNHDEFVIILRYANTSSRATILVSAIADLVGWVDERKPNISTQKISPFQNELTPLSFNLLGCVP